ncbi:unnamed protein product [Pneumocystis jirovecii]|uniref:Origin recognition complex subunit 2 n=2 Tax=Pneumocystis jirovecii TaxID=42068 RepID=L0PFV2_PNEJI|nr:uncharacterized protein T551_00939 [Pneumocystis jirovecii RU7]KTW31678.1 hypothetical protein T551_00939 [Pneumocystis jirovecii RU7]CCJ31276.1 unnamed protein product [Pneumocystis jirovecii]
MNNQERLERWMEPRHRLTSHATLSNEFRVQFEAEIETPSNNGLLSNSADSSIASATSSETASCSSLSALSYLHETQFDQWVAELRAGFNIILYGYGSKCTLLTRFASYFSNLSAAPVFIIHGLAPTLSLKTLLTSLEEAVTTIKTTNELVSSETAIFDSVDALMFRILQRLSLSSSTITMSKPLDLHHVSSTKIRGSASNVLDSSSASDSLCLIVVHNIDSEVLRTVLAQRCLAQLARVLPLIASADCICTSLICTRTIWHDATTFIPFTYERTLRSLHTAKETKASRAANAPSLSSVRHVLAALTPAARSVFRLLISEQLQMSTKIGLLLAFGTVNMMTDTFIGTTGSSDVSYGIFDGVKAEQLFKLCVGALVVSHAAGFRALLTEFVDHCVVRVYRDAAGTERLSVPLSRSSLMSLLEELNQNEI